MATVVKLDLTTFAGMNPAQKRARLMRIGRALWREWGQMADTLKSRYRGAYRDAMNFEVTDTTVTFSLEPADELRTFVRSIEYGFGPGGVGTTGPYDMRMTLLKLTTKSIRTTKKGVLYLNVPFRITTRQIEQMANGVFASKRGTRMLAQQLDVSRRITERRTVWGTSLEPGFANRIQTKARTVRGIGRMPAHHSDPLSGLYKFLQRNGRTTYGTFRTISQTGKPWVHPGMPARRFMRKLKERIGVIVAGV